LLAWDAKPPPRSQLLCDAGMNPGHEHFNIGASYYFAKFRLPWGRQAALPQQN